MYAFTVVLAVILSAKTSAHTTFRCENTNQLNPHTMIALNWNMTRCTQGKVEFCEPVAPAFCRLKDIDECASNPCVSGICADEVDGYTCTCDAGWDGENCDIDIDECASNPCVSGICNDEVDRYTCTCDAGWAGTHCDLDIDECASNPCVSGICTDNIDGYTCTCDEGWGGEHCDIESLSGAALVPYIVPGARVVRNPDYWTWGDQDCGGPGSVTGAVDGGGWCSVTWDCGHANTYRMGSGGNYDLLLA